MTDIDSKLDQELWDRVVGGDISAFEEVVSKYQGAVVAVAFSQCGDFAASQDVAQETFLAAWISRDQLREREKLLGWLCSIARRLAAGNFRAQTKHSSLSLTEAIEPVRNADEPIASIISREEETQVWNAIAELPATYREPLVLFYQASRSVEQIASALGTTIDAAKQRLSRGRELVRASVLETMEGVLTRARPNRSLTLRIMAAVAGFSGSSALASKGVASSFATSVTSAIASKAVVGVASGASTSFLGAVLGPLGGLFGAYLGTKLPALTAPTMTERRLFEKSGRSTMAIAVAYTVLLVVLSLGAVYQVLSFAAFFALFFVLQVSFFATLLYRGFSTQRKVNEIRSRLQEAEDPNLSTVRSWFKGNRILFKGRSYQSKLSLLGIPWIDIQVSDVQREQVFAPKTARGWIAIGDRAHGILLGLGGVARGLIAFGGLAYGGIAVGGLSIGVLGIGGAGFGIIALGGLALGLQSLGGLAIGWDAYGGAALGWQSATGGVAIAKHAAFGGFAVAKDYATGGNGIAEVFNTPEAQSVIQQATYRWLLEYQVQHPSMIWAVAIGASLVYALMAVVMTKLMYARPKSQPDA